MEEEEIAVSVERPPSGRADWILLESRLILAIGLLGLLRLVPSLSPRPDVLVRVLLGYILLIGCEGLLLWRRRGLRALAQISLALDVGLSLVLLFFTGATQSPLLPYLLFVVTAISLRLGLASGLGLNLAALLGYGLLVMRDQLSSGVRVEPLRAGLFGAAILTIGVLGGLLAEQVGRPAEEQLRNLQLQVEELRSRLLRATKRARAFYEMSHTLSVSLSYQKVLEGILQECRRLLDFSVGVVLLTGGKDELSIAASSGMRVADNDTRIYLVGGTLSNCLATAEPVLLEHLGRDAELCQVMALQRCRSGMCVPLRAGLRNYGAIVLGSMNEQAYSRADLEQLVALAHFATIAIQNAQLYQDLREERDKIVRAEENVRKELSRDLHDGPAQALAAITMNVEYIRRLLGEDPKKALAELDNLEQLARRTSWDIRTMLFELRPVILETQGLVPTLEQYVQRFPASEGVQVHLDTGGFDQRLDPKVEATVFTIMQEAVNNARKHAKAKNIWMRLARHGNNLVAAVQDDGMGFDVEAVRASYEKRGSFGLLNMEERARLIGGRTEIRSVPGKGTAVIISVPLEAKE
ncbi:MAG: GAF domain-containing sensor histidine kinase [Chloroflexia bacterium]